MSIFDCRSVAVLDTSGCHAVELHITVLAVYGKQKLAAAANRKDVVLKQGFLYVAVALRQAIPKFSYRYAAKVYVMF